MARQALLIKFIKTTYNNLQEYKDYREWKLQMAFVTMKLYLRFRIKLKKHGGIERKMINNPRNGINFMGAAVMM